MIITNKCAQWLLFALSMTLTGCTIVPVNREGRKYFDQIQFADDIHGRIEIVKDEGYNYSAKNNWARVNVERGIINEISESGRKQIEAGNSLTLRLKYHLCVKTGDFPTDSMEKNIFIAIFTLGLWNTGQLYDCRVDLIVIDRNSGKEVGAYHSILKARSSNSSLEFLLRSHNPTYVRSRVALPTREVLRQYTVDTKAGRYDQYRSLETSAPAP